MKNSDEQIRKALGALITASENFHQDLENDIDGHYEELPNYNGAKETFLYYVRQAKAALAEPLRNCDVGAIEEQIKRWRKFCDTQTCCEECPCNKEEYVSAKCFARWAQMPYEEVD